MDKLCTYIVGRFCLFRFYIMILYINILIKFKFYREEHIMGSSVKIEINFHTQVCACAPQTCYAQRTCARMGSNMIFSIKPLSSELISDYLDFFDNRAFTDGNPNGPCYCTSPNQDENTIKKMISEFETNGVKDTVRKYAVDMLNEGKIQGYLAFDGKNAIGWCNAADIDRYVGFVPEFAREKSCGKTISIVCFEIAPEYRGMGIASAFIDRVCTDAKMKGYVAVEGYAKTNSERDNYDFNGPIRLYEKAGFSGIASQDGQIIMRKVL